MKGFIGSANIDTNSRLCMASAVAGYKRAFGADTVPNDYTDLEQAELIVLVGSNLAWCHPVLFQRVSAAKAANPEAARRRHRPAPHTDRLTLPISFLQLRPGTDVVLFNGLLNHLRREDALDLEFLDAHTEGFGAALRVAKESAASIPAVAAACGLAEDDVLEFYRSFARTPRTVTAFSQGVNQSTSGTDKVNAIINVHLATGRIGKAGMGPFSLTGQPNAMGGREVGGLANQLAAHMDFAPDNVARVARFWNAPRVAAKPGLKAVDLFEAIERGEIKAVWIMSTNPVVSMPDAERVRRALAAVRARRRLGLRARHGHDALRARAAAGGDVGREVRHRHELGAAHLAAAAIPARPRRGAARLVDRHSRSPSAWVSAPHSLTTRRPRSSASTRGSRHSRTTERATSTSAASRN